jgi:endonuclease YncB( thermonuclease family)
MRILAAAAFVCLSGAALAQVTAVDGDTVSEGGVHYRLENIDAPETGDRAECDAERMLGENAARRMALLLASGPVTIRRTGRIDKYRRPIVFVSLDGRDIGSILIAEKLAVAWRGRRHDWCGR